MASAQHPNRVYFTSLDRSPVDTNTDFSISFDTPIENSRNFEVVSASFPNTFRQFASYETILYFYHENYEGGAVAIGVPMSLTPFAGEGKTGENLLPSARPTGRKQYIDGRYFVDGADLTTYLNDWIQSLSANGGTDFPASTTGLCPFYFPDDDPTQPPTFFANEAATGVDFSKLSFTYDDTTALGGEGSLKLVFEDSAGNDVRIASILDFGNLSGNTNYPSLMCYKLGYTALEYEAFGDVVNVRSTNNQFSVAVNVLAGKIVIDNTNDTFSIQYTEAPPAAKSDHQFTITQGAYTIDELVTALNAAQGTPNVQLQFTKVGSNTIQIGVTIVGPATGGTDINLNFAYNGSTLGIRINYAPLQLIGTVGGPYPLTYTGGAVSFNDKNFISATYTIPPNDYSPTTLAALIQDALQNQNVGSIVHSYIGQSSTVTEAGNILTFTFTSSITPYLSPIELIFSPSDSVQQGCKTLLGFVDDIIFFVSGTPQSAPNAVTVEGAPTPAAHVAPDPINLIRTSIIYFASSLSAGEALTSAGRKDVLFAVSLTSPIGSVQLYQSSLSGIIVNRPPSVVRNLRVTLLDDNFQIMEPMPQNSSVAVEIHFSYDDENNVNNVSTNPYANK